MDVRSWKLPSFAGYSDVLVDIASVLLVAAVVHAISIRVVNHRLARAQTSERRTAITFLRNAVKSSIAFVTLLAIIYSIPPVRSLAVGVFAGASILAAIVGFASQAAFSNIVSGVFIVIFKPFRVGDIVKIDGEIGTVEDITLRQTVIRALENKRLIYPNSVIDSQPLINWTIHDETAQKYMFISLDFESDMERATAIIREEAEAHPDLLDMRSEEQRAEGAPRVEVQLLNLDNSMLNFRIPLWAKDLPTAMRMTWDLHRAIKKRFDEEGIALGRPPRVNYGPDDVRAGGR